MLARTRSDARTRSEPAPTLDEESTTRELWCRDLAALAADPPPSLAVTPSRDDAGARLPLSRVRGWMRARLRRGDELALPALCGPSRPEIPPLRRGALEAWWSARRAHVGIDEFLRERLSRYLAHSRIGPEQLPVSIAFDGGRVVVAPRADLAPAHWVARYVRANGEPALAADVEHARAEVARAETTLDDARARLAEAQRDLDAAARAPSLAASDGDGADPYGRPPVPPPWGIAIGAAVGLMVLGDAWQLALPLLRGAGVAPSELALAAAQKPEVVALPLLLALGASTCLFVFSAAAIRRARALLDALPARWHAAVHVIAGATSLAIAVGLAWAILVRGGSEGASGGRLTSFLLAIALPLAAPPMLALARRLHGARADATRAAAAWDHVHGAAVAQWSRSNALVTATERECAVLEATRAAFSRRFHELRRRGAEVARLAADEADSERCELRDLARAIVRALELDRRAYVSDGRRRRDPAMLYDCGSCDGNGERFDR